MEKRYWVYILASAWNGTLYIGATSNLIARVHQHKRGEVDGFTKRYGVSRLVWFEEQPCASAMVLRERQLKEWQRAWKAKLIERENPRWLDLYEDILG